MIVTFLSCSKKNNISKIDAISGYWQIQKVEDVDGNKKNYPVNEVYDYFKINSKKGFHKKVTWQPDGTFLVNDLQDEIKIVFNQDKVFINFTSKYGNHIEELVSISENEMVLKSNEAVQFYYTKVILDNKKNGKEIK